MIEPYSIGPERLRCRYCGAKAVVGQEICLQCGRLLRPTTTNWVRSGVLGLLGILLIAIGVLNWQLGGDENRLRIGIDGALARLDQIAAEYDPRAIATTSASMALVLHDDQPTENQTVDINEGNAGDEKLEPLPEDQISAGGAGDVSNLPTAGVPLTATLIFSSTPQPLVAQPQEVAERVEQSDTATLALALGVTSTVAATITLLPTLITTDTPINTATIVPDVAASGAVTSAKVELTASMAVTATLAQPIGKETAVVTAIVALPTVTPLPAQGETAATRKQSNTSSTATLIPSPTASPLPTPTALPTAIPTLPSPTLSPTPLPTPTQSPVSPATNVSYTLQQGDTPLAIANRYRISVEALLAANGLTLTDATRLRVGQTLIIPLVPQPTPTFTLTVVPVYYKIQAGDTPVVIARKYGISVDALLAANGLTRNDATRLRVGQSLVIPGVGQPAVSEVATFTATPVAAATLSSVATPTSEPATQVPASVNTTPTIRLESPRLRNPENGNKLGCDSNNRLIWDSVPAMLATDRYLLHLGYVSAVDANGVESVTWVLRQELPVSDPSWRMDPAYCGLAPQEFKRRWQWYVEVIDPAQGGSAVSLPSAIWSFTWE